MGLGYCGGNKPRFNYSHCFIFFFFKKVTLLSCDNHCNICSVDASGGTSYKEKSEKQLLTCAGS